MRWYRDTGDRALPFLLPTEWAHVNLNERVITRPRHKGRTLRRDSIWILMHRQTLHGVLWFRPGGYLLPAFSSTLRSSPPLPVNTSAMRGVMGTAWNMKYVRPYLPDPEPPTGFRIMTNTCTAISSLPPLHGNLIFETAGEEHWDELYPLELAYQREEVYGSRWKMDDHYIAQNLRRILRTRTVFILKKKGVIVAKANTNSSGKIYDQLGGVYTLPEYRGQGLGSLLISQIIDHMSRKGRRLSLFVKNENSAAVNLYKTTGFRDKGPFHLEYFKPNPRAIQKQ